MNELPASSPSPDGSDMFFIGGLNPNSQRVITAFVKPSLATEKAGDEFEFKWRRYFMADRLIYSPTKSVFKPAVRMTEC